MSQVPTSTSLRPPKAALGNERRISTAYETASCSSLNRLRRLRDRQVRQFPLLCNHLRRVHEECEEMKQELATVRQQRDAFQQETCTLRTLVKLTDHPELAAAAASEAATQSLREEVRQLRRRVRQLEQEKVQCLLQSEEMCEAAEFYKQLAEQPVAESFPIQPRTSLAALSFIEGSSPDKTSATCAKRNTPLTDGDADDMEAKLSCRLNTVPESARLPSCFVEEKVKPLHAATAVKEASRVVRPPCTVDDGRNGSAGDAEQRLRFEGTIAAPPPASAPPPDNAFTFANETPRVLRFTEILRGQNRMLTKRVEELAQRNVAYAKEVAALKLSRCQLRGGGVLKE
ncbi:hypothetical protein ABB37_00616 [Leptomonas pyrrhocoris]|uniref:Uncharacterized protein n=1 Tax=Leptomonas pyrrhocoris TaxID=157538 RepID=A0A0M9GAR3_LEPPY|nr:hypothetical protein ABB37_00616 [Leptomonas pyrrhocoris]XP_015664899.1 hypothetical protein ABB37_00616 [Leptomonas pyrrhocoris]KPA86459.1 hypothetical protein ABB37_00616 [Leptomonas pyrrhocoris]KPA86460.1 hypothetical protein ABB37_00616 [Leptomonas pyrrhocoris]|eukprot:XP_015664898.1 hypothetical protein ABB37_00616 [Leptomonas pyrrhocoris]